MTKAPVRLLLKQIWKYDKFISITALVSIITNTFLSLTPILLMN